MRHVTVKLITEVKVKLHEAKEKNNFKHQAQHISL